MVKGANIRAEFPEGLFRSCSKTQLKLILDRFYRIAVMQRYQSLHRDCDDDGTLYERAKLEIEQEITSECST